MCQDDWGPINNFTDVSFIFVVYGENTFWAAGEFFAAAPQVSFFGIKTPHSPVISCSCATWVLSIDCMRLGPILLSMSHQTKNRTHFSQAICLITQKCFSKWLCLSRKHSFSFLSNIIDSPRNAEVKIW